MTSTTRSGPIRPADGPGTLLDITPESAGWSNVAFAIHDVRAGSPHRGGTTDRETAIVTIEGAGRVLVDGLTVDVARTSVFDQVGRIVYVPPGVDFTGRHRPRASCRCACSNRPRCAARSAAVDRPIARWCTRSHTRCPPST